MKASLVFAALVLSSSPVRAAEASLADLIGAPYTSDLTVSPRGDRVAFCVDDKGRRSVYVAAAPDWKARALVAGKDDDGRLLAEFSFSGNGALLAFVRGREETHDDGAPNPSSDPRGVPLEIVVVRSDGGAPVTAAEGHSPALSPDGKQLAFVKEGKLQLASGDKWKEVRTLKLRGQAAAPRWSPDGTELAFTIGRKDHSFVAVYRLADGRLTWMQPEIGYDFEPVWSPDGKQLAFLRVPGKKTPYPTDAPEDWVHDVPLTVLVADAESGAARIVYRGKEADGSVASTEIPRPLAFADGQVLFLAERDGWQRIWSVPSTGGEPRALSPARCEVEDIALAFDRKSLLAVNNCADGERRQIARVSLDGKAGDGAAWSELVAGKAASWGVVALAGGGIAFVQATATQPGTVTLLADGAAPRPLLTPWSVPGLVEPQPVTFRAADGMIAHGELFLPPSPASGKRAAIVYVHGGPIRQMLPAWHYMEMYHQYYGMNQLLARRGFIVLALNYRMGIGYGHAFREPPRRGPLGASEYGDLVAAAHFLRARPDVDPRRVGVYGVSYGGLMTAQALARNSDLFAVGVDHAGLHDWSHFLAAPGEPQPGAAAVHLAFTSSPVAHLQTWRSPVLFLHGDDDNNVPFGQTIDLATRLRERGVTAETLTFPDETHYFLRHRDWVTAMEATLAFLTRYLQR